MDRKTLTGFILIGAILLLWPSYLELVSPSEEKPENKSLPDTSLVEKYTQAPNSSYSETENTPNQESRSFTIDGGSYVAKINNSAGGSFLSFDLKKHLKRGESSLDLIDNINKNNLLVSFINQSGEVVVLKNNWSVVSGASATLSEASNKAKIIFKTDYMGRAITKELTFYHNSYEVDVSVGLREIKDLTLDEKYMLSWSGGLPEH